MTNRVFSAFDEQHAHKAECNHGCSLTQHTLQLRDERGREVSGVAYEGNCGDDALGENKRTNAKVHLHHGCEDQIRCAEVMRGLTRDTPYVSHLASARGNTAKSTARIPRIVISIMCALYVVNAGRGAISSFSGAAGREPVGEGVRNVLEGSGVPDSRVGNSKKTHVGKRSADMRVPGLRAKKVIDSRRGRTRTRHSATNCKALDAGRRDFKLECNAIDAFTQIISALLRLCFDIGRTSATAEIAFTCPMLEPVIPETKASFADLYSDILGEGSL